jgi:hypothetical protein
MRDRRLQGVQAIIQWQQSVPAECDDDGFIFDSENC